ncbi:hypothetical protein ACFQDN_11280 [Pseudomonas asuensis]|uniref:Uncharacterized protein n=1 Tax=Pseudomonas asuensis TaxID=1825787 RepID=A0ABQ2GNI0_9PSED|nr:hypothetical protein [Pseudomonas asuensis]GGM05202.1 hypothetical protein GCM10009425_15670 [Pseudomonas asuensis]
MSDPFERGAAYPPPTLGEGCTLRYDPDALTEDSGTDFPGAAELWETMLNTPMPDESESGD